MHKAQNWQIGERVAVGFMRDLLVLNKVASPGNFKPDGYILLAQRADGTKQVYAFIPHHGITKCRDTDEAREVIKA